MTITQHEKKYLKCIIIIITIMVMIKQKKKKRKRFTFQIMFSCILSSFSRRVL